MTTQTETYANDETIFAAAVDALTGGALGEKDYDLGITKNIATYDDVAAFLSQNKFTNKFGKCLTGNTLKQIIFRCKKNPCLMERYKPDWNVFEVDTSQPDRCVQCGTPITSSESDFCSITCQKEYAANRYAELMN